MKIKNFKFSTALLVYGLFIIGFIVLHDPNSGKYWDDSAGIILTTQQINESVFTHKIKIYFQIAILVVAIIRFLWLLKQKKLDIFSIVMLVWSISYLVTYNPSRYELEVLDKVHYGKLLWYEVYERHNLVIQFTEAFFFLYPLIFKLIQMLENKINNILFKTSESKHLL